MACSDRFGEADGKIAFVTEAGALEVIAANGAGHRAVPIGSGWAGTPHWTSDGRIVYSAGGPGADEWHMSAIDVDGSNQESLTASPAGTEFQGELSPDGQTLVYVKGEPTGKEDSPLREFGLFIRDAAGDRQLTEAPAGGADRNPTFSPDGKYVAFSRIYDFTAGHGRASIMVATVDGSSLKEITDPALDANHPRWSPAGDLIAFSINGNNFLARPAEVWLVAPDGGGLRKVIAEPSGGQAWAPDWSPTAEWIVYNRWQPGREGDDLSITDIDSSFRCQLLLGSGDQAPHEPDWGPDQRVVTP